MTSGAKYVAAFFCLVLPGIAQAQSVGQVECPRGDGYMYLYSSMTTLDVRTTLQCGDLQVVEEVIVDGVSVIPAGATATGLVKEVEPRRRLGHGGKLAFSIDSVRLKDDEKAAVRSFQESTGANNSAGVILPLASGKDVVFTQGTEFTAYVDGDMHLKKQAFQSEKNSSSATPALPDRKPTPPGEY